NSATPGNAIDMFSIDPYFMSSSSASPGAGQGYTAENANHTMYNTLTDYHGTSRTIKEIVAYSLNCGTNYYSPFPSSFYTFHNTSNSTTGEDNSWLMYRNMYLAEKRKIQQRDADNYARGSVVQNSSSPYGNPPGYVPGRGRYCGCIGLGDNNYVAQA